MHGPLSKDPRRGQELCDWEEEYIGEQIDGNINLRNVGLNDCFQQLKLDKLLRNKPKCQNRNPESSNPNQICGSTSYRRVTEIHRAPPIIIFHLDRHQQMLKIQLAKEQKYHKKHKNHKHSHDHTDPLKPESKFLKRKNGSIIKYPLEDLDMGKYVSGLKSGKEVLYDCYAVILQRGDLESGEYTTFCRNTVLDSWYEYNDTMVNQVPDVSIDQKVQSRDAYILFYRNKKWHAKNAPQKQSEGY